jgi:hypothetical protein
VPHIDFQLKNDGPDSSSGYGLRHPTSQGFAVHDEDEDEDILPLSIRRLMLCIRKGDSWYWNNISRVV